MGFDTSVPSINLCNAGSSVQNILNITVLLSGVTVPIVFSTTATLAKVAVVEKTIGTVTPDKSTVMFKIFCTDEPALHKFIEGTEVSKPIMDDVLDSYSIYDLTKVK